MSEPGFVSANGLRFAYDARGALTRDLQPHVADLTLRTLPGVSHWVQEDASDEVNRWIAAWAAEQGLAP